MKKIALLLASVVAVTAFAADPVKKVEAKPAVTAPAAPTGAAPVAPAKADVKSEPAKKTEATKK